MVSERIRGRIDRLLDQIEEAADGQDWPEVHRLARQLLGLDSENVDAPSFLNVAEAELAGQRDADQIEELPVSSMNDDDSSVDQPTSFADGRYQVKSFLGEGGESGSTWPTTVSWTATWTWRLSGPKGSTRPPGNDSPGRQGP